MSNGSILTYTNRLLPYSETFIRDQWRSVPKPEKYLIGCRRVSGLDLPDSQVLVLNQGDAIGYAKEFMFKVFGRARGFIQRIRELNPVLLHAHFGPCGAVALPITEKIGIPLIITYHGRDATVASSYAWRHLDLTAQLYRYRRERLIRRTDLFLTATGFMKDMVVQEGIPSSKVQVHHHGIDTEYFTADPTVERHPLVLFVGRLVEKKGGTYLIRAMAQVQERHPEAELVVIGDGPLKAVLEKQAQESLSNFQFLGRQPPKEVKRWLNRARVFCGPSVTAKSGDTEGFGIVFVEAQAMGTPVVATNSGGIPEAVIHEETGFLADERDVPALAHYIHLLLSDDSLWADFSNRGVEHVRKKFNMRLQGQRLIRLYNHVIENG